MKSLTNIINIGAQVGDDENEILRKHFMIYQGLGMSMGGILWGSLLIAFSFPAQAITPYGYVILTIINFYIFNKTKNFAFARSVQTMISMFLPFILQWHLGGFIVSGGVMLWSILAMVLSISYQNIKASLFWLSIYIGLTAFSFWFDDYFATQYHMGVDAYISKIFQISNVVTVSIIILLLFVYFVMVNSRNMERIKQTYSKLISSEKMAALGQVSAGVAHEVNTPLGAIRTSSEESSIALQEAVFSMPEIYNKLNQEMRITLGKVLQSYENNGQYLSTKEERNLSLNLEKELENLGIKDDGSIADKLIQSGILHCNKDLILLLQEPNREEIIDLIYNILTLKKNNANIKIAAEKASRVIGALKSYLHSNDGVLEDIDIAENIEVVLSIYHNLMKHGIEVTLDFEKAPKIMAYRNELNQVWTNLIHNSIQAMNYKGKLQVTLKQIKKEILVSISDNGPGIPEHLKEKIFEPFFTTKKSGEGTGLGLDIVKKIVSMHKGTISFESEVGKGTTFYVKLPINSKI